MHVRVHVCMHNSSFLEQDSNYGLGSNTKETVFAEKKLGVTNSRYKTAVSGYKHKNSTPQLGPF